MTINQKFYEHNNRFREKANQFKAGPVEERSCNDICCIVTFILIFLFTLGGGIYFIVAGRDAYPKLIADPSNALQFAAILSRIAPIFVGMCVLSSALSVIYIFLAKTFPKCVIYSMIVLTFLVYIALIILGVVIQNYILAAIFGVIMLINACVLYCFWGYIQIGIKLLEVAGTFITEKPAVYFISLICLVINIIYVVFWVFSWIGVVSASKVETDSSAFQILSYVWIADAIFFSYFLYYNMVFLIAMACAFWYYQNPENSVMKGFNYLKYQFGPITFASIVITIITIMRILAQNENSGNGAVKCLACIMACILRCIEDLVKVLNHNSVIVMAVTGEGYIDAAKSAIGLIFDNFGLFIIIDFFTEFIELYAVIFSVIIPAIIGGIAIYTTTADPELALTDAIWGGLIILLLAIVISQVVLGMLSEVLSCVFIFYSFDCKFRSMGMQVDNIPPQMKSVFDEANQNEEVQQASLQRLN